MTTKKTTKTFTIMEDALTKNRKSPLTGVGPRDSDTELIVQMLQLYMGIDLSEKQLGIIKSLNFESITRARRKLQQAGHFPPDSPEVARRRRIKGFEIQQVAPKETAEGLQRRISE